MNKKFLLIAVILLIFSVGIVSAHGNDTIKKDSDYEILLLEKTWVNDDVSLRPDSVIIHIYADGELKRTIILLKNNDWKPLERVVLPIYNDNGDEIEYTFKENNADGYVLSEVVKNDILDYTLVNKYDNLTQGGNQSQNGTVGGNPSGNGTVDNNQTVGGNPSGNGTVDNNQTVGGNPSGNTTVGGNQSGNGTLVNNQTAGGSHHNTTHKDKIHILTPLSVKNASGHTNTTRPMLNTGNAIGIVIICIMFSSVFPKAL